MSKLHAINGGGKQVDEIMVGDVKYIREDLVKSQTSVPDAEEFGQAAGEAMLRVIATEVPEIYTQRYIPISENVISKGIDELPPRKKGSEVCAMLYDKLPPGEKRHGTKLRPFYTDIERELGVPLYERHVERLIENNAEPSNGKYPYRKMDTLVMMVDDDTLFRYVSEYQFKVR